MSAEAEARPQIRSASLWRNRNFMLFWAGESVSQVGTAVTYVALPLVAVLFLDATAFEVGLLGTVQTLPPLVVGAFVGVFADNHSRKKLMVFADVGRFLLLGWVPVAAALQVLDIWQLSAVAFGVGSLSLLFNVAYQAFLPEVVEPDRLADGNGKLSATQSAAEVGGPGIAGWLMMLGGPPVALIVDAVSYLVSGLCVLGIRTRDTLAAKVRSSGGFWANTRVGFSVLWQDAVLRTVSWSCGVMNFFAQLQLVVYFLFLVEELHFGPGLIGLLFGFSGAFGFVSAIMCDRLVRRLGLGKVLVIGQLVQAAGGICLAFAGGSMASSAAVVLLGEACFAVGLSLFGVSYLTVRQLRTADDVRGRVMAASRFLTLSLLPVASLAGGALASLVGLRMTIVIGAFGMAAACLLVVRRRVLQVHNGPMA